MLPMTLAAALLAADRTLKWYAQHSLPQEGVFLVPGLLGIERFENRGIAFGIPFAQSAILFASVVAVILLVRAVAKEGTSPRRRAALAFLLLGAASNFLDRLFFGYVIDYLRVGPWSLVNIADGMIVGGLLLAFSPPRRRGSSPSA